MSPEERQLLANLFDRVRGQAGAPRDAEAEALIADAVRAQPYAPYLLAQAVIVQEQALKGADQRIQQLQQQLAALQSQQSQAAQGGGSFLGGLFGGGRPQPAAPAPNPWGAPQNSYGAQQAPYGGQPGPQPGPWGGAQQPAPSPWGAPQAAQGGGFLRNALGAAAGVAGGVLLADSLKGLFSGGGQAASALGGGLEQAGLPGGETIVNNFFDTPKDNGGADYSNADYSDADLGNDDFGGGDDYSSDV